MSEVRLKLIVADLSAAAESALAARPLPGDLGKPQFRRMQRALDKSGYDAESRTVTLTVSSEFPVERWDGVEVLVHDKSAIDTSRLDHGISHLYNHNWDILLGRTQSYTIAEKKLSVTSKFASNQDAKQREQDIADGSLPDVSLGYQILKVEVTEDKNGVRTYNVVRWMPLEFSSVTVPADYTVGLGRSAPAVHEVEVTFRKLDDTSAARSSDDDEDDEDDPDDGDEEERKRKRSATEAAAPEVQAPPTEPQPQQRTHVTMDDLQATNKVRQDGLRKLRDDYPEDFSERQLFEAVTGDVTVDQARGLILDSVIKRNKSSEVRSASDEVFSRMSEKETRQYSLRNAIVATINQRKAGTFKDKGAEAGFEREVSDSLEKTLGQRGIAASTGNILIPSDMGRRSLQAGGNAGSTTINTKTSSEVIDLLRPRCRVIALGATEMTVDTGLLRLPRQTGTSQSQWLAELAPSTNTDMTFDTIGLSPKRNGIFGSYTMELLAQSAISVESRVRADQLASKARTYDAVCIIGTGGTMPLGLLNMTGLAAILTGATRANDGTVTPGTGGKPVTFVDINAFEAAISNVNGDTGSLGWMYTPRVRAAMRSTAKFPGTGGFMPLLPDSATGADGLQEGPLGYKAGVTTNGLPTNGTVGSATGLHTMILGVWENLIIANWGVSELVYDNITGAKQGIYQVIENEFMDVNCTHIEGFAASTTVLPS